MAPMATLIQRERARAPQSVLTFGGDLISPSLLSGITKGKHMIELMNAIGLDVAVLGNHEFDHGPDVLRQRIAESRFPWLAANALGPDGKPFGGTVATHLAKAGPHNVGFFGLITPEARIYIRGGMPVRFEGYVEHARAAVADLRRRGADILVEVDAGGGVLTKGAFTLDVPPGAVAAATSFRLTEVSGRGLAGRLPAGWSPVGAVQIEPEEILFSIPATLGFSRADATLVRYDRLSHAWIVESDREIERTGAYAFVVPDEGPTAPPPPIDSAPLEAAPEDPEDAEHASLGVFVDDGYGNRSLQPSLRTLLKGRTVTTNRWGMRDQDYPREPGPATRRFAVLGPSFVMGTGVDDEDTFEHVLENHLNGEWPGRAGRRFELLNFGLPRASLVEIASIVDSGRVADFEPDVVLVVSNMYAWFAVQQDFWRRQQLGQPLPDALAQRLPAGFLEAATSRTELNRNLAPHAQTILAWALVTIADAARRMGAVPVYAQIPLPYESVEIFGKLEMPVLARDAGFAVIDARDVFAGLALEELVVDSADHHPNAAGHRVIADRLYAELTASPEIMGN